MPRVRLLDGCLLVIGRCAFLVAIVACGSSVDPADGDGGARGPTCVEANGCGTIGDSCVARACTRLSACDLGRDVGTLASSPFGEPRQLEGTALDSPDFVVPLLRKMVESRTQLRETSSAGTEIRLHFRAKTSSIEKGAATDGNVAFAGDSVQLFPKIGGDTAIVHRVEVGAYASVACSGSVIECHACEKPIESITGAFRFTGGAWEFTRD